MPARSTADRLTPHDLHLWNEGSHRRAYDKLGSHPDGESGTHFAVWAPNAQRVAVVGDFNGWDAGAGDDLHPREVSGVWEGFVPSARPGDAYKYSIEHSGGRIEKADPFAFHHETPPKTASKVWALDYDWGDAEWLRSRHERQALDRAMSVYEVHLGSWRRHPDGGHLTYRELAVELTEYVTSLGFTHVEFLPVMEHPFYGSWGYQTTGYFAPTSRYGTPQDFMFLVDTLHQAGVGVILDWVPSHFPDDPHGLASFDGTRLYEHADPRQGHHPDWDSAIFNLGRSEVSGFLLAGALFWLDVYHVDGLRVDAVASMLYLDYSRRPGEWIPNRHGGNENLESIDFLRRLNEVVYDEHPGVQTIAEESTAWPMVSRPTYLGGLGFGMKWDMGWMHDTLEYMSHDPVHRSFHHHRLTFRMMYAFTENFMLPLSHDEVVHGKGSLLAKMPGDDWQRFANLRLLLASMWVQPGKKLLFMGGELGQWAEWNHEAALSWDLAGEPAHAGISRLVGDLNRLYRDHPALHAGDCDPGGFEWIDANDTETSVFSFLRRSPDGDLVAVVLNMTPVPRHGYRIGVPEAGVWDEILNTDAPVYGGSGQGNLGGVETGPFPVPAHGRPHSLDLVVPPLAAVALRHRR